MSGAVFVFLRCPTYLFEVRRCPSAERPLPLTARTVPERSRSQGRPSEAALAGLPLDGGESGGKSAGGSGVGVVNVVRRETTILPAWLCFEWLPLARRGEGFLRI